MSRLALVVAGFILLGPASAESAGMVEASASTERSPARRIAGVWTLAENQSVTFGAPDGKPPLTSAGQAL